MTVMKVHDRKTWNRAAVPRSAATIHGGRPVGAWLIGRSEILCRSGPSEIRPVELVRAIRRELEQPWWRR
jgi:hypothetical protein